MGSKSWMEIAAIKREKVVLKRKTTAKIHLKKNFDMNNYFNSLGGVSFLGNTDYSADVATKAAIGQSNGKQLSHNREVAVINGGGQVLQAPHADYVEQVAVPRNIAPAPILPFIIDTTGETETTTVNMFDSKGFNVNHGTSTTVNTTGGEIFMNTATPEGQAQYDSFVQNLCSSRYFVNALRFELFDENGDPVNNLNVPIYYIETNEWGASTREPMLIRPHIVPNQFIRNLVIIPLEGTRGMLNQYKTLQFIMPANRIANVDFITQGRS